jgi:hypothetical protein
MLPLLLLAATTAPPKAGPIEKEHKMVVEAVRGCPEHDEGEIVVCARDRGIAEGFRLPRLDARFAGPLAKNGRTQLDDPTVGATGIGSCSNVGAGGSTGCSARDYDAWHITRRQRQIDAHAYEDPR